MSNRTDGARRRRPLPQRNRSGEEDEGPSGMVSQSSTISYWSEPEQGQQYEDLEAPPMTAPSRMIHHSLHLNIMGDAHYGARSVAVTNEYPWPRRLLQVSAGFSWIGAGFLLWVSRLIEKQPFYTKGVSQKAAVSQATACTAFQTALAYAFCGLLCSVAYSQYYRLIYNLARVQRRAWNWRARLKRAVLLRSRKKKQSMMIPMYTYNHALHSKRSDDAESGGCASNSEPVLYHSTAILGPPPSNRGASKDKHR